MAGFDIDDLRKELFLTMVRAQRAQPAEISTEEAERLGEHAARLAKAALDGMGTYDRTGRVSEPRAD